LTANDEGRIAGTWHFLSHWIRGAGLKQGAFRGRGLSCEGQSPVNPDFRGRENNQLFWGLKSQFLGYLAISALVSLIVYLAENDAIGIESTLAIM
jgi:hypothetical protein